MAVLLNSLGVIIEKSGRKIIMSMLLSGDIRVCLSGSGFAPKGCDAEALISAIDGMFMPETGDIPNYTTAVKARLKGIDVCPDSEFSKPLSRTDGGYTLRHITQLFGDIDEYEDFCALIRREDDICDFDSISFITGNVSGAEIIIYDRLLYHSAGKVEFRRYEDSTGTLGTTVISRMAAKSIKDELISEETVISTEADLIDEAAPVTEESSEPELVIEEAVCESDDVTASEPVVEAAIVETEYYVEPASVIEEAVPEPKKAESKVSTQQDSPVTEENNLRTTVRFYADGNRYILLVERRPGKGQLFNHGFLGLPDVTETVKPAYMAFREADRTVSPEIHCKDYNYWLMYESSTFGAVTDKISLPTFIGLCASCLGTPVKDGLIVFGDMDRNGSATAEPDISSALDDAIEEGFSYALIPEANRNAVAAKAEFINCLYYSSPSEAVRLALDSLGF